MTEEYKFKVGDICKIISRSLSHAFPIGEQVSIISIDTSTGHVRVISYNMEGLTQIVKVESLELIGYSLEKVIDKPNPPLHIISIEDNKLKEFIENFNDVLVDAEVDEPAGRGCGHRIVVSDSQIEFLYKLVLDLNKQETNNLINKQEENNMSYAPQVPTASPTSVRRVVNVKLIDDDKGLPVEYALVGEWFGIVTEDPDPVVIQEVIMNEDVANTLVQHNEVREEQVDLDILQRTGNSVNLRPVKLKQLRWVVSNA